MKSAGPEAGLPGPKQAAIIANPVAGGGRGRSRALQALELLRAKGVNAEVHWTEKRGEATRISREVLAAGVKHIAGCGGDGTLNEIANALAFTEGIMGVLPGGRGNDLCRSLGIPRTMAQAADIFATGQVRTVDLGKIGTRYFNTIATLGFDAEVSRAAEQGRILVSGPVTYLVNILKCLVNYRPPFLRLEGDFGHVEGRFFLAATSNTPMYGGGFHITPPAKMDDGLFHVCLIDPLPALKVLWLMPSVRAGRHVGMPWVRILPTRRLKIESDSESWVYADGERMGQTPVTIEIAPGALKVMAPLSLSSHPQSGRSAALS